MTSKLEQSLAGTWMHSHEEDANDEVVYRKSSFDFPPSRGRMGFDLRPDHSSTWIGIAARDGASKEATQWEVRGGSEPALILSFADGRQRVLPIVNVNEERLIVRKGAG